MSAPIATYRLQLGPNLTFDGAARLVPYLRDLGVSHLYLSPVMQARSGSTHGYDVVDPTTVSAALGGEDRLRELAGMGLPIVVDIVPNHMAATDENRFWRDRALRNRFFDIDAAGRHRRFFDIDDLAGVRQEDPEVFAVTHAKVFELVHDGVVAGVRVDHIDGLADPADYLRRLREGGVELVWVEKILEPGERLPPWPVSGTTGYEFLVDADALFVDPEGRGVLDEIAGIDEPGHAFAALGAAAKLEQVGTTFPPEVATLRALADLRGLDAALAALPVYRTYIDRTSRAMSDQDWLALAALPADVADALLGRVDVPEQFVARFQQTTGAVMAKGVEDTAMYRHVRLLALNEVGGNPDRFGLPVAEFHAANQQRMTDWPLNLLAATTHDTKRSADVRARIGALAGFASEWRDLVDECRALFAAHRARSGPDAQEELFVLQTLVGAWPLAPERLDAYLVKALREAKRNTSWTNPDTDWEKSVVETTVSLVEDPRFHAAFLPFLDRVRDAGERVAIGQVVLRCTSPGVPDIYQGDELCALLLVDPDNRRPVDWDARRAALAALRAGQPVDRPVAKLFAISTLLDLRRRRRDFAAAPYIPLDADPSVCAFSRGTDVVVAVPVRNGTAVPAARDLVGRGEWVDLLAPLDDVFGDRRPAVYERLEPTD
jgi:(1->4)-alpha-D-glucan 1-alpha-D-glucosylmutase